MHKFHELVGREPCQWVEAKETLGFMEGDTPPRNDYRVVMRWYFILLYILIVTYSYMDNAII
jgi:hypothetical protein